MYSPPPNKFSVCCQDFSKCQWNWNENRKKILLSSNLSLDKEGEYPQGKGTRWLHNICTAKECGSKSIWFQFGSDQLVLLVPILKQLLPWYCIVRQAFPRQKKATLDWQLRQTSVIIFGSTNYPTLTGQRKVAPSVLTESTSGSFTIYLRQS